ncbi:MAG: hypothetical protein QOK11_2270 [Pseudonocardiales bacterium]|nr:hypothetical protein [Pseudonocardiales bacterium]MDT4943696.1 hypothetical protein [Pseudonocardiales bacterium]
MKVTRRRGALRLRFDPVETVLLGSLLDELAGALESDALDDDDPVRQRLFPDGYRGDDDAAAEFRSLTEGSLSAERSERARDCARQLTPGVTELGLDGAAGERWIQVLNDLRLALGTRLEITEEDEPEFEPDDPDAEQRAVYYWLTGMQDAVVRALMR